MVPNSEEDTNELSPGEGEQLSCVVQRILLISKTKTHPQRYALF